jgi:glycosyltransferase involved in cell wall biosynthesis
MAQASPPEKTVRVMVATPGGPLGQGGIDRIMTSLKDELARQNLAAVQAVFVPTRGNGSIALSPVFLLLFCLRMVGARLLGRLDVVHVNLASDGSTYRKLLVSLLARLLRIPYVLHLHGAEYMSFWSEQQSFLHRRIRSMFLHAARIIVLGRPWRDFVTARVPGIDDRVAILANATAQPVRPHIGGRDTVHVLFLGRIGERKGVPQLCDALAALKDLTGWRATLAGDGDVEGLRTRLDDLGLSDGVSAPGWQQAIDVERLLSEADILVLPSYAENLPVSVIEGMAEGLAIVATPVGAVEDIIEHGRTGLLVPPGDVEALRTALEQLICQPDLRQRLGNAARELHREKLDLRYYAQAMSLLWIEAGAKADLRDSIR